MCTTPPVIVPAKVQQRQSLLKCVTAQIQGAFLSGVVTRWEGILYDLNLFSEWKINSIVEQFQKRQWLRISPVSHIWDFFSCFRCSLSFIPPPLSSRFSIAKFSTGERVPLTFPPASHPLWNQSQPPSVRFCQQLRFFGDNAARFSAVFCCVHVKPFKKMFQTV